MRTDTGIIGFNEKIGGGFPEFSTILIKGPAGIGKTTFCNQFIYQGLKKNEAAIYMSFNAPPEDVKENMKKFGWNIEGKIVLFIDVYSWQSGTMATEKYVINDPADLNEFNIKIFKAIKELSDKNLKRCCVDALSTLFVYIPSDLALKFVSSLFARLKTSKITSLATLEKDVLDTRVVAILESLTDGTIDLGFDPTEGTQRLIRIVRMKNTKVSSLNWMEFEIRDNGIRVI